MKAIKKVLRCILIIILLGITSLGVLGYKYYKKKVDKVSIEEKRLEITTNYNYTNIKDVSPIYTKAVVAVEDRRYYNHGPIDYIGLIRAMYTNIKSKGLIQGGSSITQQTAKNLYFMGDTVSPIIRKPAELFIAIDLEKKYSKDEILDMYINTIYFGSGYYGIKEASKGYLNKEPNQLNLGEAAMLAGLPNAPSLYSPKVNKKLCKSRTNKVISSMQKEGLITKAQMDAFNDSFIDDIN